jgi:hypothetical protein
MARLDQRSNRRDRVSVGAGARLADTFHRTTEQDSARRTASQPPLPEHARWNAEWPAVEFGVEIGEYRGLVRVPRRVFQWLLPERPTPERCVEAYYLQRTRFETTPYRKLRRRQLTEDGMWKSAGGTSAVGVMPRKGTQRNDGLSTLCHLNYRLQPG